MRKTTGLILCLVLLSGFFLRAQESVAPASQVALIDLIAGTYARHSPAYYEHLVAELEPRRKAGKLGREGYFLLSEAKARKGNLKEAYALFNSWREIAAQGEDEASSLDSLHLARLRLIGGDYAGAREAISSVADAGQHGDRGYHPAWFLQLDYLAAFAGAPGEPIFPHFNGSFANYLADTLGWESFSDEETGMAVRSVARRIAWQSPENPHLYELLGDLLFNLSEHPDGIFLSGFAYLKASSLSTSATGKDLYLRKAIYAPEGKLIRDPEILNPVRTEDMKEIFAEEKEKGDQFFQEISEAEAGWISENADVEMEFGTAFAGKVPTFDAAQMPEFWREETDRAFEFVGKEIENERGRRNFTPNDEITNPNLDIKNIKKDVRFNAYALLVIGTLFVAIAVIWIKFRKMVKVREAEEAQRQS